MQISEVFPVELKAELDAGEHPFLLDVREAEELLISKLDIDANIPMSEIPARLQELDPQANIVVICRSGARSARVTQYMQAQGFKHVRNLALGMNGWASTVDPSMQRY